LRNVIFGSGIVGLIARYCLPGNWTVVPFRRSRYFSFSPPLSDNFIIRDAEIDDVVAEFGGEINSTLYSFAYSLDGQIIREYNEVYAASWLNKLYCGQVASQALAYWRGRMSVPIYTIRAQSIYEALMSNNIAYLKGEAMKGDVTEIGDHFFVRNGVKEEFDNAISTIPLTVLYDLMRLDNSGLKTVSEYYYHLTSEALDFEGVNQLFVVDEMIDFYRCTNVCRGGYMFYSTRDISQPGAYFMQIIGNADLIDGTMIKDGVPVGPMPDLTAIESKGIFCVGSSAQHDWCMDVGSCIKRLVNYSKRGHKPR